MIAYKYLSLSIRQMFREHWFVGEMIQLTECFSFEGMTVTRSALGACVCETADPEYYSMLSRHSSVSAAAFNAQMALDRLSLPRPADRGPL